MPSPQPSPEKPTQLEDTENVINSLFYIIMLKKKYNRYSHLITIIAIWFNIDFRMRQNTTLPKSKDNNAKIHKNFRDPRPGKQTWSR